MFSTIGMYIYLAAVFVVANWRWVIVGAGVVIAAGVVVACC